MKQSINFSQFADAFQDMNRSDNFSYAGLRALFDYIEDLDDQCETDTELDVIALCCEFSEYPSATAAAEQYFDSNIDVEGEVDDIEAAALDYLNERTTVLDLDGPGIIIQDF